jgi:SAM-dependent methyltransferase
MNLRSKLQDTPPAPVSIRHRMAALAGELTVDKTTPRDVKQRIEDKSTIRDRITTIMRLLDRHTSQLRSHLFKSLTTLRAEERDRLIAVLAAIDDGDQAVLKEYGLNVEQAWLKDILVTTVQAKLAVKVGIYMSSPGSNVDLRTGHLVLNPTVLAPEGKVAIELARLFKQLNQVAHNTRFIIVVNDLWEATEKRPLTENERDQYLLAVSSFLEQEGVIGPEDVVGREFLISRESAQVGRLDTLLMARLRQSREGRIEIDNDGNMYFKFTPGFVENLDGISAARRHELAKQGTLIKDADGTPTSYALDAASYTNALNKFMIHLVCVDDQKRAEQERTYALLRATDIVRREWHHKIFFDSQSLSPELVAYGVGRLLQQQAELLLSSGESYSEWQEFDDQEYFERWYHYNGAIMHEDKETIKGAIHALKQLGIQPQSLQRVADIGAGPNLYPAMIVSPYVAPDSTIELLEFSPNRRYLEEVIQGDDNSTSADVWRKFEKFMVEVGGDLYKDCRTLAKKLTKIQFGDIFQLPGGVYDFISSFYVSESIVDSPMPFNESIRSLARALKPEGILMAAHMVGSEGYHAGKNTSFPAINLTAEEIKRAYHNAGLEIIMTVVAGRKPDDKAREGYHGMMLVVAHPRSGSAT